MFLKVVYKYKKKKMAKRGNLWDTRSDFADAKINAVTRNWLSATILIII